MAQLIPSLIPAGPEDVAPPVTPEADTASQYDIAIGGVSFVFSNTPQNPMIRETVQLEKTRVDQAMTPGENTLTNWWIKSQDSFHGGAGQRNLEPAFPTPYDHVRYDISKNVDVFVPGVVSPLPDTSIASSTSALQVLGVVNGGVDAIVYLTSGNVVNIITDPTGTPVASTFSAVSGIHSIATDGQFVYAASNTIIYKLDPASLAASVTVATLAATATTGPVLGWVKNRLLVGVNGGVYEVNVAATGLTLGATELKFQHPTPGWTWRCFSQSPTAALAAGDALGQSSITQFSVVNVSGVPELQVVGDIAPMPIGERILSMVNNQGTFLILGTTRGVRVGTFDTYFGNLTVGPLELDASQPEIPAYSLATRDRFVYAAGYDYDEGGLLTVDLGSKVTDAGRFAWAPGLITPAFTTTSANSVAVLPVTNLLVFSVPGTGVLLEGSGPGTGRASWLRTSRIRYSTTEPKVYKLGRVRGNLASGEIQVSASNPTVSAQVLISVGDTLVDPDEFRLLPGLSEWMSMTFTLLGSDTTLTSYQVKALPGTRRQRHYQFVVSCNDHETSRGGNRIYSQLSSRERLAQLEELAAVGDEVILQEFTPSGVISTRVVIETLSFHSSGRPENTSDIGGDITILLRTVES